MESAAVAAHANDRNCKTRAPMLRRKYSNDVPLSVSHTRELD